MCHLKSGKFGSPNLGVFWGNCVLATVKRDFLVYFDRTNWASFSLDLSQHLCSLLKQLLVLVDESPLPHFGI